MLSRVRFVGCVSHDESNLRAAFTPPCNRYQAGFFERTKRPAFCIGFDAPVSLLVGLVLCHIRGLRKSNTFIVSNLMVRPTKEPAFPCGAC